MGLIVRGPEKSPRRGAEGTTLLDCGWGRGPAVAQGAGWSGGDGRRRQEARNGGWEVASRSWARTTQANPQLPQSRRFREPYRARREVQKVREQRGENSKRVYSTSSWLRGPAMETSTMRRRILLRPRSAVQRE